MTYNKSELKNILKEISDNNLNNINDYNLEKLLLSMIENLGDIDPELRDNLIFTTFYKLAIKNFLSSDLYLKIYDILIKQQYLLKGIEETESDLVFTRSFTSLFLAVLVYKHREKRIFSKEQINNIIKLVIKYMEKEKDYRGYIETKGWAHSAAHIADLIDELSLCSEIDNQQLMKFLELIKKMISVDNYVFTNAEDERMTTAVLSIIKNSTINHLEIISWIQSFKNHKKITKHPEKLNMKVNIKNFLRSLYFRLMKENISKDVIETIYNELDNYK